MKVFIITDIHGNKESLNKIKEKTEDCNLIICAGDFTIFSNEIDQILGNLNKIGKPVLLVHGNHEDEDEVKKICNHLENCYFIHKNKFDFGEYVFIGYGGGGFSFKDHGFEKQVKKFKRWCSGKKCVLVTHAPPYGTKIDKIYKEHAGNKSIRKFIETVKPVLAISGHLHECVGQDKIGKTIVINPGYKGKVLDI